MKLKLASCFVVVFGLNAPPTSFKIIFSVINFPNSVPIHVELCMNHAEIILITH